MAMRVLPIVVVLALGFGLLSPGGLGLAKNRAEAASSPDLIIENITWSPEEPSVRDTVTFTVVIKNQGSTRAGSSQVNYYINGDYLTADFPDSIEPGDTATETFFWEAQDGTHTIKAVADATGRVTEIDETNNEKTVTIQPLLSDLIVESITWSPEEPSDGDSVTFAVTVKNRGEGKAGSSRVYFYIDDSSRGYQDVPYIVAGGAVTVTFSWIADAGSHTLRAVIDKDNQIAESDEGNNETSVIFQALLPDLIIEEVTWSPESPVESDNITFTVFIKNQGTGKADYSQVAYYLGDAYLGSASVASLDSGASDNKSFNWIAGANPHDLRIIADANETVAESDEGNNEKAVPFPILPDLVIESVTWSPENAGAGSTLVFTVTIKNQGSAKAGLFGIHLYIDDAHRGYQEVEEIEIDDTVTKTFNWVARAGSHTIKVVLDSTEKLAEIDETNNEETFTYSEASAPDLVIQDISWSSANPPAGETVTFTVTVKNQGGGKTDTFYIAYYIDDAFLDLVFMIPMSSGATETKTFNWVAEAGSHIIKAVADFDDEIVESDENNNEKAISFPRLPDLIVESITWSPRMPSISDNITFTATVQNKGSAQAGPFAIYFYIDEVFSGSQAIPELKVESRVLKTFNWIAGAGSHIIKAVADFDDEVVESDENNNVTTANLTFAGPPEPTPAPTSGPETEAPTASPVPTPEPPEQVTWPLFLIGFGVIILGGLMVMLILRSR